jgi:hypothetical protein
MVPYLKGLHMTIDSWRPGWDKEGLRVAKPTQRHTVWEWEEEKLIDVSKEDLVAVSGVDGEPPEPVTPIACLRLDIGALETLTSVNEPPTVLCQTRGSLLA